MARRPAATPAPGDPIRGREGLTHDGANYLRALWLLVDDTAAAEDESELVRRAFALACARYGCQEATAVAFIEAGA